MRTAYLTGVWGIPRDQVSDPSPDADSFFLYYDTEALMKEAKLLPPGTKALYDREVERTFMRITPQKAPQNSSTPAASTTEGKTTPAEARDTPPAYALDVRKEWFLAYLGDEEIMHAIPTYKWFPCGTNADNTPEAAIWRIWSERGRP